MAQQDVMVYNERTMADENEAPNSLISWKILAYPHYDRGAWWYIVTGIGGGALLVVSFITNNFLLAAITVMAGIALVVQGTAKPPTIEVHITPLGIQRGTQFISFTSVSRFWIIYDPPVKSLYLNIPRSMFPTIHIPIDDQDPIELRSILKNYTAEDLEREHEPVSDTLSRIFKI
jgi:hypothetical protein